MYPERLIKCWQSPINSSGKRTTIYDRNGAGTREGVLLSWAGTISAQFTWLALKTDAVYAIEEDFLVLRRHRDLRSSPASKW